MRDHLDILTNRQIRQDEGGDLPDVRSGNHDITSGLRSEGDRGDRGEVSFLVKNVAVAGGGAFPYNCLIGPRKGGRKRRREVLKMTVILSATPRSTRGKQSAKRLRREGLIPAVLYGHRFDPVLLSLDERTFKAAMRREKGLHGILNLQVEGEDDQHMVVVKEVQRDPIKDHLLHVDLQKIHADEELHAVVSLHFTGEPVGVRAGGILQHYLYEVNVRCLPKDLPEHIPVDVSHLNLKENLRVRDLPQLAGVKYLNSPDEIVAAVTPKRVREAARVVTELFAVEEAAEEAAPEGSAEEGAEASAEASSEAAETPATDEEE